MQDPNQTQERCTCGDTAVSFYPWENQHEPNCWDCYDQAMVNGFGSREVSDFDNDELPF